MNNYIKNTMKGFFKEAVDVRVLQKAFSNKALGDRIVKVKPKSITRENVGGIIIPAISLAGAISIPNPKKVKALGLPVVSKNLSNKMLLTQGNFSYHFRKHAPKATKLLLEVMGMPKIKINQGLAEIKKKIPLTKLSPSGNRALNTIVRSHENFELRTPLKEIRRRVMPMTKSIGHTSPTVLMKEKRLLNNLTGPGSEEAVQWMKAVRSKNPRESKFLNLLDTKYKDIKLNRHDRRRMLELIRSGEFWE